MTLSLGAVLTGSSLIIMIWSPGISFPSEGPPGDRWKRKQRLADHCKCRDTLCCSHTMCFLPQLMACLTLTLFLTLPVLPYQENLESWRLRSSYWSSSSSKLTSSHLKIRAWFSGGPKEPIRGDLIHLLRCDQPYLTHPWSMFVWYSCKTTLRMTPFPVNKWSCLTTVKIRKSFFPVSTPGLPCCFLSQAK